MSNENGSGGEDGDSFDDGTDEVTRPDDEARLFCTNLGLSISEGGRRIASLGSKLAPPGTARRRAALLGFLEEVDTVTGTLDDARDVIRDYARNAYSPKREAEEEEHELTDEEIIE